MERLINNTRKPDICFSSKGRIDIKANVSKALGLNAGDVINILKDDGEYYLYVAVRNEEVRGSHVGQCHLTKQRDKRYLRTNSQSLCRSILDIVNDGHDCAKLAVGDVVELDGIGRAVPIITRHNLI